MFLGLHDFYKRIRGYQDPAVLGNFGHYVKMAILDRLAITVGILTAAFNLPQLLQIWVNKNIEGVSLISWAGFTVTSLFWFCYALFHKEKVLIVTFGVTLIFQALIVLGILVN